MRVIVASPVKLVDPDFLSLNDVKKTLPDTSEMERLAIDLSPALKSASSGGWVSRSIIDDGRFPGDQAYAPPIRHWAILPDKEENDDTLQVLPRIEVTRESGLSTIRCRSEDKIISEGFSFSFWQENCQQEKQRLVV